jgi:hypothetical protein
MNVVGGENIERNYCRQMGWIKNIDMRPVSVLTMPVVPLRQQCGNRQYVVHYTDPETSATGRSIVSF